MNRWTFGLLLLVLAVCALWWGQHVTAQPDKQPNTSSQTATKDCDTRPVQLQFWTLQLNTFAGYFNPLISDYQARHPQVCIHWVDVPFSEGEKRALTAVLSEDVPDVVNLNPAFSATLQEKDALLDLADWIPSSTLKRAFAVATLAAATSYDGHLFGVPWYLTSQVVFYNRTLLAAAGMSEPPTTQTDLLRLARALRKKNLGYALLPPLSENGYFLRDLLSQGIPLYDSQGQTIFADNPSAVARLQFWVDAYQHDLIPSDSLTETHRSALERYQAGTLALLPVGASLASQIQLNAPQVYKQTWVKPQPYQDSRYVDFSLMVLTVPARSRHPREATDFALFVANANNQLALSRQAPVLPSALDALNVLRGQYFPSDLLSLAQSYSIQQVSLARTSFPQRAHQPERNRIIDAAVQSALLGRQTPKQALEQAQVAFNAL